MDKKELKALDEKISAEIEQQPIEQDNRPFKPQDYNLTPEEESQIAQEVELEKKFGDSDIKAAALGAGRGLTFGLSDQALVKSGIYTAEELSEIKKRNELASITGEIGAIGASALATGGASAAAKGAQLAGKGVSAITKAGLAAEKLTEKAFAKVLAEQGKKSLAKEIVKRSAPKAIGSAVEGAAYGVGQLISEDALGEAELNAENVLAAAGTGALLGGVAGGMFSAPAVLVPAVKKFGGKITDASKKINVSKKLSGDVVDDTLKLYGFTPSQITKTKRFDPKFSEELPEWTAEKMKLGIWDSSKKLNKNLGDIKQKAASDIEAIYPKLDKIAKDVPDLNPSNANAFGNIAKAIDDKIIKRYELPDGSFSPGYSSDLKAVKKLRDEYIELAKREGNTSVKELHKFRVDMDDKIKKFYDKSKYSLEDEAKLEARTALNNEIFNIAEKVSSGRNREIYGNILNDLKNANKNYSYASKLEESLAKKVDKDASKNLFDYSNIMTGVVGSMLDPTVGVAAVAAKKFLESDLKRKISILSSVERQQQKVNSTISNNVSSFIKKAASGVPKVTQAAKTSATKAFVQSNLALPIDSEKPKKPSNRKEAFKNIKQNIIELTTNPEKLEKLVARRTIHLQSAMPNITQQTITKAIASLQFLATKLPKPVKENSASQILTKREFQPSDMQLAKFERYVKAVENPMSVVESLSDGTITREGAEALRVVYPQLFQKLQTEVMEQMQENPDAMPYNKRLQLGILLDIPTDASLEPQNIAGLQQNLKFQGAEELPGGPTAARADSLDMADRQETKQNRIAQR